MPATSAPTRMSCFGAPTVKSASIVLKWYVAIVTVTAVIAPLFAWVPNARHVKIAPLYVRAAQRDVLAARMKNFSARAAIHVLIVRGAICAEFADCAVIAAPCAIIVYPANIAKKYARAGITVPGATRIHATAAVLAVTAPTDARYVLTSAPIAVSCAIRAEHANTAPFYVIIIAVLAPSVQTYAKTAIYA